MKALGICAVLKVAMLGGLLAGHSPGIARADYLLDTGDVLEIAVFGVADFNRRTNVNVDGDVAVPFLGEVRASGLSISALRQEMERRLVAVGALRDPTVTVELVEHRPFYISGDVMRPGAHPFHPAMTVRHAVALAGGYSALRYQAENPLLMAPEIESRHASLWVDLVARHMRVLSLTAELEGSGQWDPSPLYAAPLPRSTIDKLAQLEQRALDLRLEEARLEVAHLEETIMQSERAVEAMRKAVAEQEEGLAMQVSAAERAVANNAHGITPNMRVDDERRALASLRGQHMDATSRLLAARRDMDQQERSLERSLSQREQDLIAQLHEATSELERVKFHLKAAGEQVIYTGALKAQLKNGASGPDLTIFRASNDSVRQIPATQDTVIQPGDVLDVTIRPERLIVAPSQ